MPSKSSLKNITKIVLSLAKNNFVDVTIIADVTMVLHLDVVFFCSSSNRTEIVRTIRQLLSGPQAGGQVAKQLMIRPNEDGSLARNLTSRDNQHV